MDLEVLKSEVAAGHIDTVIVAFTDHYGRSLGKRFDAEFFIKEGADAGTHSCNYLLTVDMEMEPVKGYEYASWEKGYGDFHVVPDLATLRMAAWTDRTAIVLCDLVHDGQPVTVAPRSILRRQVARASDMGLVAKAASELEFYLYDDSYRDAFDKNYANLAPAGWYIDDYHVLQGARVEPYVRAARIALRDSEVPVENSKGEWGRGQHELNIRYAAVDTMADRHVIMKQAMKEIADSMGISVTFMAKPHSDSAGSSCHIHMSLWDSETNAPVFVGLDDQPSQKFYWFLGGWMKHVNDFMVMYAPTINSYKRYEDGSWAPTRIAWSDDNRTAGFRVVGHGKSLRIECRIPGADANPYLAFAASLASGLDGIENQIDPPDAFRGDVYQAAELPRVPYSLAEALENFENSTIARELLGDEVVNHYSHFYRNEVQAYGTAVTDWERSRYFERI
ncbi:MAG: glutamine synthetase family protein [Acidimicrobiales bacterium]|jgi:glutamine synthetase